eukprot:TRINITY_DN24309_c0_g1_i1.p2 TRINITY_DN24309_c0_g1~~TRINITY_DN24309_c0_g1_i1.p2  ORF type:complete len:107 (-),score=2.03 TRINITY_DN24309_c0_g1_i1:49-369(-)
MDHECDACSMRNPLVRSETNLIGHNLEDDGGVTGEGSRGSHGCPMDAKNNVGRSNEMILFEECLPPKVHFKHLQVKLQKKIFDRGLSFRREDAALRGTAIHPHHSH